MAAGETVLQFPVDITSTGTDVFLNVEPDHTDGIQGIPGLGNDAIGLVFIGNVAYIQPGDDGEWAQVYFLEDVAGSGNEGHYTDTVMAGNIGWSGNPKGINLFNSVRGIIADNTAVCESGTVDGLQARIQQLTQQGFDGENNVIYNNASRDNTSSVAGDLIASNHDITPAQYAGAGIFDGTGGFAPTNVAEMLAAFARTDLDGVIDYDLRTYDLPSINTTSSFTFTDATGEDVSDLVTTTGTVITSVTNGQASASSFGALASVQGGNSPQFRITDDAVPTTVITDWTDTPAVIEAGEYLWIRDTSSVNGSDTTDTFIRVGRSTDVWSISTVAASVPDAFVIGEWSLAPGVTDAGLNITVATLPFNGGSAITDIEYDIDASDSWISLGTATTGTTEVIMAASATEYDIRLRPVNAVGNALPGDTKTETSHSVSFLFEDDFTSDTREDYQIDGDGGTTFVYDGTGDRLTVTPGGNFSGITMTAAVTIVSGRDYRITVNVFNDDAAGGSNNQVDMELGSTLSGNQYGTLPTIDRVSDQVTADMVMDITATGTTLFFTPRCRTQSDTQFHVNYITVLDIT